MSDQTLWELAQTWAHVVSGRGLLACPSSCHRCQLEQWAREMAKEADAIDLYPFKNQTAREISDALKEMLGVPTEESQ